MLKDLDFQLLVNNENQNLVNISILDRRRVILAIKNDIDFLESQGIMDYSLLLAVEHLHKKADDNQLIESHSEIMFSKDQEEVYRELKDIYEQASQYDIYENEESFEMLRDTITSQDKEDSVNN